jgi:hypothetical protein
MHFKIVGPITHVESIAAGTALCGRRRLWKVYGKGRWRKLKGAAAVEFHDGTICHAGKPIGTKPMASERRNIRSSAFWTDVKREAHFVICIGNRGYAASLELRKVYQVLPDEVGMKHRQIRVIDESGEDYLYPEEYFVPVRLPQAVERAVRRATA